MEEDERYYYALQADDLVCLRRLLREGANVNQIFVGMNDVGLRPSMWSALHICCEKGHFDSAKELLEAGADPNVNDRWNWTPLFYAAQREWHNLVQLLLKYGSDVNARDIHGRTSLHFCVDSYESEYGTRCMKTLLENGANPSVGDMLGRTPLWLCAAADGHVEHMKLLLESGPCGINILDVREKRTPVQAAIMHASRDRLKYVELLLDKDADVNSRDTRNHTSLMNVMWRSWSDGKVINDEDLKLCRMILEHNYNVNEVGKKNTWIEYGGPAINMATERGNAILVDLLLEHGADPDVTDDESNSSVMLSVHQNKINILARLIAWNANLDIQGQLKIEGQRQNITPLRSAIAQRRTDAAMLLALGGCDLSKETYLWTSENVPEGLVMNLELWTWLRDFVLEPHTLLWLCRREIRRMLGKGLWLKIHELTLPPYIETVIKMKDVLGPWF